MNLFLFDSSREEAFLKSLREFYDIFKTLVTVYVNVDSFFFFSLCRGVRDRSRTLPIVIDYVRSRPKLSIRFSFSRNVTNATRARTMSHCSSSLSSLCA